MLYLLLSLVLLGVVAALLGWRSNRRHGEEPVVVNDSCATCNGDNDKCEQECMMEAATQPVEYFDLSGRRVEDLEKMPRGVYFKKEGTKVRKIVKMREQ